MKTNHFTTTNHKKCAKSYWIYAIWYQLSALQHDFFPILTFWGVRIKKFFSLSLLTENIFLINSYPFGNLMVGSFKISEHSNVWHRLHRDVVNRGYFRKKHSIQIVEEMYHFVRSQDSNWHYFCWSDIHDKFLVMAPCLKYPRDTLSVCLFSYAKSVIENWEEGKSCFSELLVKWKLRVAISLWVFRNSIGDRLVDSCLQ